MTQSRSFYAVTLTVAVLGAVAARQGDKEKESATTRKRVAEALAKLMKGEGNWKKFSVTYSDLHPLHGGLSLTIDGTGEVKQKAVGDKDGDPKVVSEEELKRLVEVLRAHEAWEQRVPERPPIPDESRAWLAIKYGDDEVVVWEWYNDLSKNKRVVEVREAMKKAAWYPFAVAPPPRKVEPQVKP